MHFIKYINHKLFKLSQDLFLLQSGLRRCVLLDYIDTTTSGGIDNISGRSSSGTLARLELTRLIQQQQQQQQQCEEERVNHDVSERITFLCKFAVSIADRKTVLLYHSTAREEESTKCVFIDREMSVT